MTQLSPQTITKIHTYIDDGVPLEDLFTGNSGKANIERVKIAEQVYERFCQDPMLDIKRCLQRTFGRRKSQLAQDMQVVALFTESLDEPNRKMLTTRARKTAENLVRIGQQMGDWKAIDKGLTQLIRLDRLDEEEVSQEDVRNTAALPVVIVGIETVNQERQSVDNTEFKRLMQKYGGKEDDFGKMLALRARRLQGEDMNMLAHEDIDSFEEIEDE